MTRFSLFDEGKIVRHFMSAEPNKRWQIIEQLGKKYHVKVREIIIILLKQDYPSAPIMERMVEKNREKKKELTKEWKETKREQRQEKAKEIRERRRFADYYTDGKVQLSSRTIRGVRLVPKGKSLETLTNIIRELQKYFGWVKRVARNQLKQDYDLDCKEYVKKYGKPKLSMKALEVNAKKWKGNFKSGIMNTEAKNVTFAFQGTHDNTSGNGRVKWVFDSKENMKWLLLIDKMQFTMVFPHEGRRKEGTRSVERYKTLLKYFDEHGCPSGEIILKGNKIFCNFSLERDEREPKDYAEKVFIIEQFKNEGFHFYFFNEDGTQILKLTCPLNETRVRMFRKIRGKELNKDDREAGKIVQGILKGEIASIMKEVVTKWEKKFSEMQPIFILCPPEQIISRQEEWNYYIQRVPFGMVKGIACSTAYNNYGEVWTSSKPFSDFEELTFRLGVI